MKGNSSRQYQLIIIAFLANFCLSSPIYSDQSSGSSKSQLRIIPLPEIESAAYVRADFGKVYIQDKTNIAVYSFETGRFLKHIGRSGQGPGEFTLLGSFYLAEGRIVAEDIGKTLFFSPEGDYLGQLIPPSKAMGPYPFLPVGSHFVGIPLERAEDGRTLPPMLIVYDQAGKPLKRLLEVPDILPPPPSRPGASGSFRKQDQLMVREYFDYIVYDHKIFVADSSQGLSIKVFDETGNLLYEIRHPIEKTRVPKDYRDRVLRSLPKKFLENNQPIFPPYFPSFVAFKIDDGKIYAITPAQKNQLNEVITMDLKGQILDRSFRFQKEIDYEVPIRFARTFDVEKDCFVWVEYNEPAERYELHIY